MRRPLHPRALAAILLTTLIGGCSPPDDRILQQSLARQAQQNAEMARHTQQIVETSRQLVESDARARAELIELQQHLQEGVQSERQSLDHQHEQLESERQAVARQRLREPLIAGAIITVGVLLGCIAPLILAFWVLRHSWAGEAIGVDELLIHELASKTPVFLPAPPLELPPPVVSSESAGALAEPAQHAHRGRVAGPVNHSRSRGD